MTKFPRNLQRRRRLARVGLALGLMLSGSAVPAAASPEVPSSCKVHSRHVLNPGCVPALMDSTTVDGYPNLVPDVNDVFITPEILFDPNTNTFSEGRMLFWFDTWAQNLGQYPAELWADQPLDRSHSTVSQCVSWTETYVCREKVPAGDFTWHEEHQHFHFNDFADYELRRLDSGGDVDYSASGLVGVSEKVSFCLMDSQRVRPDALPLGTYATCTNSRQGITPGWTDIYDASLPGQQFSFNGLADGVYALVIDMNTSANLREADYTDNHVEVIIDISATNRTAQILEKRRP